MSIDEKVKRALEAIQAVFSDTSVSPDVTAEKLQELADELSMLIQVLENDMRNQSQESHA
jgi:3'-phosphoadenosine 5'-phosphosulfate sulfotransferase (PAPS reductase)/FAD synthetase